MIEDTRCQNLLARKRCRARTTALGALAVITSLAAGIGPTDAVAQDSGKELLLQGGEEYRVQVQSDQIGLLLREDARLERLQPELERTFRAEIETARDYGNGLVVVTLGQRRARAELDEIARRVTDAQSDLIAKAGFVVTFPESDSPLVVTDEFVAQFAPEVAREEVEAINAENGVELVMENPFAKNQYLLAVTTESRADALEMANRYDQRELVEFAHPNFLRVVEARQAFVPNDPLFGNQWHLDNTGQSGGTVDADIDADRAWTITQGNADVLIAVIDGGFQVNHPDLAPNLWTNPGEIPNNGQDDDGNTLVDDVNGWDFTACVTGSGPGCGDNTLVGGNHGTAVAGAAAARGNNNLGVSGSCPNCRWLPIRINLAGGADVFGHGLAFGYAQTMGADVITNSWGYPIGTPATANVVNAINNAATNGRGGLGSVVLFAMNNINTNDCTGATPDISSIANVIGVSRVTNQDRFSAGGFGNCMDVLGTTHNGTLWGVTTDLQGNAGYNSTAGSPFCPSAEPIPPPANAQDYTFCFNGTSFAAPVVAGTVGLILSVNPDLTRLQVQQLLQDAADKVEDSLGAYAESTGFSTPATGQATHGYGRVNAFEAVRLAADAAVGGRGAVDIMIRDNRLDWGNTEQPSNLLFEPVRGFIAHWRSVDIKVDAPPFVPAAPTTSAAFDAFAHEDPLSGQLNRVYVRVRNRGPVTADEVRVKLHWAFAGTGLPALPADFWTQFPNDAADTSIWHPIGLHTLEDLAYSGASVAGGPGDAAQVVSFDFQAPTFDSSQPNPSHYCLFAVIDSPQDPVSAASMAMLIPDQITPQDNNVTHRNVNLIDSGRSERFELLVYVRNPFREPIRTALDFHAPRGWEVGLKEVRFGQPFPLDAGKEALLTLIVQPPKRYATGTVTISQHRLDTRQKRPEVLGGVTYEFGPEAKAVAPMFTPRELFALLSRNQEQLARLGGFVGGEVARSGSSKDEAVDMIKRLTELLTEQTKLLRSAVSTSELP